MKVSGTKNLKAGWVTVKISSTDDLLFTAARPGMAAKASASAQGIRPHKDVVAHPSAVGRPADTTGTDGSTSTTTDPTQAPVASAPAPATAAQVAGQISSTEGELVAFGGGSAPAGSKAVTYTVKLPAGKIAILDLNTNAVVSTLTVGKGSGGSQPHADAKITEGNDHSLHGPSSLSRSGIVEFSNTGSKAWHDLGFLQLVSGATKSDVVNFFAGKSSKVPFNVSASAGVVGSEPLSPQHSEYVRYSVSKGNYALIDLWTDDKTGKPYVTENSVKIIKVK